MKFARARYRDFANFMAGTLARTGVTGGFSLPRIDPVCRRPGDRRTWRRHAFASGFALSALIFFSALPASAQQITMLRDTETEDMLRSYETPIAKAAGINPVPRVWLLGDPIVNAFATYGDGGENIFIFSGIILYCKSPNELIGVMAHETGHIAAGHLSRTEIGAEHAMVPMLLSMVLGAAVTQAQMAAFTRVQESTADQIALKLLPATHQSPQGLYSTFERMAAEEAQSAYK